MRKALIVLELLMSAAGIAGSPYGIADAPGLPLDEYSGTPFEGTTTLPGTILLVMVGLFMCGVVVLELRRDRDPRLIRPGS